MGRPFLPIYNKEETDKLSEEDRQALSEAILRQLSTDGQIRGLLREKTQHLLPQSASKKRTARQRKK